MEKLNSNDLLSSFSHEAISRVIPGLVVLPLYFHKYMVAALRLAHLLGLRFFARCSPIPLLPACGPIGLDSHAQRRFGRFKFADEANPGRAFDSGKSGAILRFKSWVYDAK